ncbi:hypothetical protein [Nesterenkonia aerolata]|uniref:Uncharacterized protein n=1 Tax=Nesterenkonia aerolata TaxID=3074079 RepID=A0ABU2DSC8_9MICC|nr:hypothetical protein [Nesterenkonia sp. LY-0111]MDR8019411.1 hypothetical protein [Nesterenkonia sp. LY-0111]
MTTTVETQEDIIYWIEHTMLNYLAGFQQSWIDWQLLIGEYDHYTRQPHSREMKWANNSTVPVSEFVSAVDTLAADLGHDSGIQFLLAVPALKAGG